MTILDDAKKHVDRNPYGCRLVNCDICPVHRKKVGRCKTCGQSDVTLLYKVMNLDGSPAEGEVVAVLASHVNIHTKHHCGGTGRRPMDRCWHNDCGGEYHGVLSVHYPGGDPENAPAHRWSAVRLCLLCDEEAQGPQDYCQSCYVKEMEKSRARKLCAACSFAIKQASDPRAADATFYHELCDGCQCQQEGTECDPWHVNKQMDEDRMKARNAEAMARAAKNLLQ